jgi:hypothetical protein
MRKITESLGFGKKKDGKRVGMMSPHLETDSKLFDNFKNYFLNVEQKRLGRPIVGGDVSIDLTNYANFQYTGPLWMGS